LNSETNQELSLYCNCSSSCSNSSSNSSNTFGVKFQRSLVNDIPHLFDLMLLNLLFCSSCFVLLFVRFKLPNKFCHQRPHTSDNDTMFPQVIESLFRCLFSKKASKTSSFRLKLRNILASFKIFRSLRRNLIILLGFLYYHFLDF